MRAPFPYIVTLQEIFDVVTFICPKQPYMSLRVVAAESHIAFEDGKQVIHNTPERWVKFNAGMYETDKDDEIELIRNHGYYTGRTQSGEPLPRIISELQPQDENQAKAMQYLQQMGAEAIVQAVEGTKPVEPVPVVQDPAAATAAQQNMEAVAAVADEVEQATEVQPQGEGVTSQAMSQEQWDAMTPEQQAEYTAAWQQQQQGV